MKDRGERAKVGEIDNEREVKQKEKKSEKSKGKRGQGGKTRIKRGTGRRR